MRLKVAAILAAGICWGFMGYFTRHLAGIGIGSEGVLIIRYGISALLFGVLLLVTDRSRFKVKLKDLWCFLGAGLVSLLFFTYCYFTAISMMSLSAAAILLYIAPSVVTVLSVFLFKEKFTKIKAVSLVLSFIGCCLVSGIAGGVSLTLAGVLWGVGAGVGYALYTIFSRFALQKGYNSLTINFYSCLLAAVGAVIIWRPVELPSLMTASAGDFIFCIVTAVLTSFVPYLLYTYGLTGVENGKASVLASIEPVVASLLGILYFYEPVSFVSVLGVVLVLAAVVLLNSGSYNGRYEAR